MTPKNKSLNFIPYILILFFLGLGIFGYYHYNTIIDNLQARLDKFDNNQAKMEKEFVKINDEYNSMMSSLSEKDQLLIASQAELKSVNEKLQSIFDKSEVSEQDLGEAKALISQLKSQLESQAQYDANIKALENEIQVLEQKNNKSEEEVKRYKQLLQKKETLISKYNQEIAQQKELIQKGSTLRLIDFKIKGVNVKANGKEVETDKARKADKMRISFRVNANNISDSGEKDLYLCLYNNEGKLAHFADANPGTLTLQSGDLVPYTDHLKFNYEKGVTEEIKFDWENKDFEKGDYNIKVYENGILIGSETKSFR